MTTRVGFAVLDVIPGMSGFQSSLNRGIDPAMTGAGKRAGSRFGSAFKGTLAAVGVFSAASGLARFLGDSVDEGREAVRVGAQTKAVIKSTGGVAKVSEKQVGRLSDRLSKMAGIDDEVIQSGGNLLLSFKDVRNEVGKNNKIYDDGLKSALNLSVGLDRDLKGSVLQVGKALQDPVAGLTALGRAGVQFSAEQKDAIKNFVESGDKLSAQKIILKELDSQFAGSAKAQVTEADKLKVAWNNFKEQVGTALIPVLEDLSKFMRKEGIPKAKEFFRVVQEKGVPALQSAAGFAKDAANKVKGLVDGFRDLPGWAQKILATGVIGGTVAVKLGMGDLFKRGSTPVNPLYVLDVSGGGPTKPGKVPGALGKLGLFGAILAPAAVGLDELHNFHRGDDKNGLASLGRGGINDWFDEKVLGKNIKQLDTLQLEWDETRNRANDYFQLIQRNKNVQLRFTVSGIDLATQKARDYYSTLLDIRALRLDFDTPVPGQPPNRSPGGNGGDPMKPSGRTVVVNNNFNVNTIGDAEKFDKHRRQQVAMGGFG